MTILFSVLIVYILFVLLAYKRTQKAYYHPEGESYNSEPNGMDIFLVFMPVVNILVATMDWRDDKYKKPITFFKPKNPLK